MRRQPRGAFVLFDEFGDPSVTAEAVVDQDEKQRQTGLIDQYGRPLVRLRERVKFGFVP